MPTAKVSAAVNDSIRPLWAFTEVWFERVATTSTCSPGLGPIGDRHGEVEELRRGAQRPDTVTSWITSVTPAADMGSQVRSEPTAATSWSIFCSVGAMVNSLTGSARRPALDPQPVGAGGEVAADRG